MLGAPAHSNDWGVEFAAQQLREAGFRIVAQQEAYPDAVFTDIGAVVYYLRAVPWQIAGFSVEANHAGLLDMHRRIVAEGGLRVQEHYFIIEAVKASGDSAA